MDVTWELVEPGWYKSELGLVKQHKHECWYGYPKESIYAVGPYFTCDDAMAGVADRVKLQESRNTNFGGF